MSNPEREGLIGRAPATHPTAASTPESQSLPAEEHVDGGDLSEDLQDPEEKRNATDGYAPADDEGNPAD